MLTSIDVKFPPSVFVCYSATSGYKSMFSFDILLQKADVIGSVVFSLFLLCFLANKNSHFFFAKHVNFSATFSCSASMCTTVLTQPRAASRLRSVFGAISSTIDVILPDIAIVFQILPKPAGCEELAGGI